MHGRDFILPRTGDTTPDPVNRYHWLRHAASGSGRIDPVDGIRDDAGMRSNLVLRSVMRFLSLVAILPAAFLRQVETMHDLAHTGSEAPNDSDPMA
ncbi:hypothetical protein BH23PLA1_BH23PLA1_43550 [soil metagenome]